MYNRRLPKFCLPTHNNTSKLYFIVHMNNRYEGHLLFVFIYVNGQYLILYTYANNIL